MFPYHIYFFTIILEVVTRRTFLTYQDRELDNVLNSGLFTSANPDTDWNPDSFFSTYGFLVKSII